MTADMDMLLDTARIVKPEDAAIDQSEMTLMQVMEWIFRAGGVPFNVVQFTDGVTVAIIGWDPSEKEGWRKQLAKAYAKKRRGSKTPCIR